MFQQLMNYCRWNALEDVKTLLAKNPGIDITQDDGMCVRIAIRKSSEMFHVLMEYFSASLPQDQALRAAAIHAMADVFEEHIDFEDLSPEMMNSVTRFIPDIAEKCLIEAASAGYVEVVKELCAHFVNARKDVISAATTYEKDAVIYAMADIATTIRKKAITFCDAADSYAKLGKLEKAHEFYEKAISIDPSHITPYLHCANTITTRFCTYSDFNAQAAAEAEDHYNKVISYNTKYSCAYKKLGTLYLIWSQHDTEHARELAQKACDAYIQAIECKIPQLKYDSLYAEIEHLAHKFTGLELEKPSVHIQDSKLKTVIEAVSTHDESSCGVSIEDTGSITEEDIEYEDDGSMDTDLEHLVVTLGDAGDCG